MGCDIHTMVEVRYPGNEDSPGSWRAVKSPMWDNPYYDSDRPISEWNTPYSVEPFNGRNYRLFAWLADVRNDDGIKPLAAPRGVPADASKKWKKYVKRWGRDLHSTSYFTLTELLEADYLQKFIETGFISVSQYLELQNGQKPKIWSVWPTRKTLTSEEVDFAVSHDRVLDSDVHVETSWERDLSEYVGWFRDHTVERMKALVVGNRTTDDVRLVFGFDN